MFMDGPYAGNRHDAGMVRVSILEAILMSHLKGRDGRQLYIYGDPAYADRSYLVRPFKGPQLTEEQQYFNTTMSRLRIAVECSFGKIVALFPFVDFKKNLKLRLQPVDKYYLVATILTNCHTCFYGSEINTIFGTDSPSIEEYLGM